MFHAALHGHEIGLGASASAREMRKDPSDQPPRGGTNLLKVGLAKVTGVSSQTAAGGWGARLLSYAHVQP